jgi:hypothetical protein
LQHSNALLNFISSTGLTPLAVKTEKCFCPEPARQLRQIDPFFIKGLKKRMMSDPSAPGTSAIALLCKSKFITTGSLFKETLRNQYEYEVLGGLHTILAKKELMVEDPG